MTAIAERPTNAAANELLVSLAWPEFSPASETAAQNLAAASDDVLDAFYPKLVRQKIFPVVIEHLEKAGADVDEVTVSSELVRTTYPFGSFFSLPLESRPGRISFGSLREQVEEHSRRLLALLAELTTADDCPPMLLLYGKAIRLAYPSYRHGLSHDLDLYVPSPADASRIVTYAMARGFALSSLRTSRADGAQVAQCKLGRVTDDGFYLCMDVLAGGKPGGGRHGPPWRHVELWDRRRTTAGSPQGLVPSAEDMLILLADKTRRRAEFSLRHFNDARFLLITERDHLDWDYLGTTLARKGLLPVFSILASEAERASGDQLFPSDLAVSQPDQHREEVLLARLSGRFGFQQLHQIGAGPASRRASRSLTRHWGLHLLSYHALAEAWHFRTLAHLAADSLQSGWERVMDAGWLHRVRTGLRRLDRQADTGLSVVVVRNPRARGLRQIGSTSPPPRRTL